MASSSSEIRHVSDTALMVAACRAREDGRAHPLVNDPFAAELAGPRGFTILDELPAPEIMCFGVAVRSHFLDAEVRHAVNELKVETVLSVGAGLDTRPWRLELPAELRWIEVDFPEMLEYKHSTLSRVGAVPQCRVERLSADLNDAAARAALWRAAGPAPALLVTEGLLMYLPEATVRALATEPPDACGVRYWLIDVTSPAYAKRVGVMNYRGIADVRASDHINGAQVLAILAEAGWVRNRHNSYLTDLLVVARERLKEVFSGSGAQAPRTPLPADDPTGITLFRHV
jgi:methyltransferase (TIGR00027 family)